MYSWFFKLGVFLLITGCSSYKFDESLLKLNKNEQIGAVGQITTVTSESQRNFLNDRAATLLNTELSEDEAIELMIVKSPDDYSDPSWYKHPEGHQAYEYSGELPEVSERFTPGNSLMPPKSEVASTNFKAVKPNHRKS